MGMGMHVRMVWPFFVTVITDAGQIVRVVSSISGAGYNVMYRVGLLVTPTTLIPVTLANLFLQLPPAIFFFQPVLIGIVRAVLTPLHPVVIGTPKRLFVFHCRLLISLMISKKRGCSSASRNFGCRFISSSSLRVSHRKLVCSSLSTGWCSVSVSHTKL